MKQENFIRRKKRRAFSIINKLRGRPRMIVYRSNCNIYCQIIDNDHTVASASSLKFQGKQSRIEASIFVGQEIAKKALEANIKEVVFDISGYTYHGRVKALRESAIKGGLNC